MTDLTLTAENLPLVILAGGLLIVLVVARGTEEVITGLVVVAFFAAVSVWFVYR